MINGAFREELKSFVARHCLNILDFSLIFAVLWVLDSFEQLFKWNYLKGLEGKCLFGRSSNNS